MVVDKPAGWTSHDVVASVRGTLGRLVGHRVAAGHTGTLDPMATGVLPILVGSATRLAPFFVGLHKVYDATIQLGSATDTQDATGRVIATAPVPALDEPGVVAALLSVRGPRMQIPPMYSALKVEGKRLYELARQGKEVPRRARPIEIRSIELLALDADAGRISFRTEVTSGTYVRSLGHDVGKAAGTLAHLVSLRRLAVGEIGIDRAVGIPLPDDVVDRIVPRRELLADVPTIVLTAESEALVRHGRRIEGSAAGSHVRLMAPDGELVAVGVPVENAIQPRIVFV